MRDNIFGVNDRKYTLSDYMNFNEGDRGNLGGEVPISVYRLMEYSIREQLLKDFGKDVQISVFRKAGYCAGVYFAENLLDLTLSFDAFIAQLQTRIMELKIGVLRIENIDSDTGKIVLSVAEDADCSGLPLLGDTVCNYNEGFISGILSTYTKKEYLAVETDCWATGERVCRFNVEVKE